MKPIIAKHIFEVYKKEYLTPHYIRITLSGEGTQDFAPCDLGANNKIMIPPPGQREVRLAIWDEQSQDWILPPEHERPIIRTYTHRAIDTLNNRIVIDFVNHGDNGPASAWARQASAGDQLGVAMKIRPTTLYAPADWYLLVGDATALPVLSVILESMPEKKQGHCIIEVPTEEDVQKDFVHPGFSVEWVFNAHPEKGSTLFDRVRSIAIPKEKSAFGYVACEYQSVRNIRQYFREELKWGNREYYAFSYWKAGVPEDQSAQERREEKQQE